MCGITITVVDTVIIVISTTDYEFSFGVSTCSLQPGSPTKSTPEDEQKHWLYTAILSLGFRI